MKVRGELGNVPEVRGETVVGGERLEMPVKERGEEIVNFWGQKTCTARQARIDRQVTH